MSVTAGNNPSETLAPPPEAADTGGVRQEFAVLLSGAGLYDLRARAKIALSGGDRVRWLNGMITNNVRDLAVGHGVYGFLLNPQGRILADLYAYNRGDSLLVDSDGSQAENVLGIFDKYIIMDDVEVANISDQFTALGIAGTRSAEVLRSAGLDIPQLQVLQFVELSWGNRKVSVTRSDNPLVPSFELWLAPADVDSCREALVAAGATPVSAEAVELWRIASGIPRYGHDIRERDLPQETEQARALHFTKGCYVGQEIVERIRSRGSVHRKFTGFEVTGPLPVIGSKIEADGKEVGEITSAASLPLRAGERRVGLGYIRREAATPGKELTIGAAKAHVAELPFAAVLEAV